MSMGVSDMHDIVQWADSRTPSWASERIEAFDEKQFIELSPFICSSTWCANESINVFSVIGTRNSSYFDWSWHKFLHEGKRMKSENLPLFESNPAYYDSAEIKLPTMSFITYDGAKLYVDNDGNHRTCIARFGFARQGKTQLAGVSVTRLEVDWVIKALFDEMRRLIATRRLPYSLEGDRTRIDREDTPGWKVDRFKPSVTLISHKTSQRQLLDATDCRRFLNHYGQPFWQRIFKSSF
jgi:hypothetical protein